ncbi:MAG: DinB family protein [Humibacillus sp.]|nr:DinB family protein [Humibacillus sp.]MDN5776612.1 DinB family protein [Humibacillus sp.]
MTTHDDTVAPTTDPETELLLGHLRAQRQHVLGIVEGLDDEALRRPVLPSGWSIAGLVNHLAVDDERFWFQAVVAGDTDVIAEIDAGAGDAWQVPNEVSGREVVDRYRAEAARSDSVILATPLDDEPRWWPVFFGEWRMNSLREVLLHVLTETACHAGHLDAAREVIDGRQWMVLD